MILAAASARRLLCATALSLSLTGCYSTWDLSPKELGRLSDYHAPSSVMLRSKDGDNVQFDEDTELRFRRVGEVDEGAAWIRLSSVESVTPSKLVGLDNVSQASGPRLVNVDLSRVSNVEATRFSVGKTVALAVGVPVGAATIAGLVFLGILASSNTESGGEWSHSFGTASAPVGLGAGVHRGTR